MKHFLHIFILAFVILAAASALQARDSGVAMTVGGVPVSIDEFEYLYNKNRSQHGISMSPDEYALHFADFKRKVIEAKARGLDTIASYRADLDQYARQHAITYIWDKDLADSLMRVAYSHLTENVEVSHIMLGPGTSLTPDRCAFLADSLLAVVSSGADFAALAERYSIQPGDGYLGFISGGTTPYEFEEVAYNTPVGGFAVAVAPYGYHVIKVHSRRPDLGRVKVRHLLRLTLDLDSQQVAVVKAQIDSLYAVALSSPAQFPALAAAYTDDPSGRDTGGSLDWFGAGQMVAPFEAAAFALADGQISAPVLTPYGYHIILRESWRPTPTYGEAEPEIRQMITSDARSNRIRLRAVEKMWDSAGVTTFPKVEKRLRKLFKKSRGISAAQMPDMMADTTPVAVAGGEVIRVSDIVAAFPPTGIEGADRAYEEFTLRLRELINLRVSKWMVATMSQRQPDYANLMQEYSDGLLLYELCQSEIWGKPKSDPAGLEAFYQANADKYTWEVPHYRGMVVMAVNDSIADAAVAFLSTLPDTTTTASYSTELRKKFLNDVRIERVIAARGDNAVVDYVAFSGPEPEKPGSRWMAFRPFRGEILTRPTCATDVKAQVSIDYQHYLETLFIEELRAKYPVEINYDLIRTL